MSTDPTSLDPRAALDLSGQRALVTGGTRGIGAGIAQVLAAGGADVVVSGRTPVEHPPAGRFVRADLSTPTGPADLARAAVDLLGGVDVVVDNVGGHTSTHREMMAMSDQDWLGDLSSNLMSAVRLDRELVPLMIAQGSGVVVHISSGAARLPQPGGSSYAAAKAAMNAYSKALATEVGPHGVRVNAILPGVIESDALTAALRQMADTDEEADVEKVRQSFVERFSIPAGRIGTIADIGYLVAFLASPAGKYITGTQLTVDGGLMPTL